MKYPVTRILKVVGLILLVYGIYQVISPEASLEVGSFSATAQDNSDAYLTIVLGLVAMGLGYFIGKRK